MKVTKVTNEQKQKAGDLVSNHDLPPGIESSLESIMNGIVATHDDMTQKEVADQIISIADDMTDCNTVAGAK